MDVLFKMQMLVICSYVFHWSKGHNIEAHYVVCLLWGQVDWVPVMEGHLFLKMEIPTRMVYRTVTARQCNLHTTIPGQSSIHSVESSRWKVCQHLAEAVLVRRLGSWPRSGQQGAGAAHRSRVTVWLPGTRQLCVNEAQKVVICVIGDVPQLLLPQLQVFNVCPIKWAMQN